MAFYYQPGVQDRRGEFLAQGISSAGQSIADAITQVKAKHDELRGYQTVLKALAQDPANGLDPDAVDKMSLSKAKSSILASEIRRNQAAARQQQQVQQAGMELPGAIAKNMQPTTRLAGGPTDLTSLMVGGGNPVNTTPGMTPLMAQITALSQNPKAVMSPQGQEVFKNMLKTMNTVPRTPQPFSMNGVTGVVDPATGTITQPRVTRPSPLSDIPVPDDWTPQTNKVGNITYYQSRPGGEFKPLNSGEQNDGELHLKTEGGKTFFRSGDNQAWKPMPASKTGIDFSTPEGMNAFLKQTGGDTNAPAADGALKVGDVQDGYKFSGGNPADPANWEKVDDE